MKGGGVIRNRILAPTPPIWILMKLVWRHQNHCHKDGICLDLRPPLFAYESQNAYESQIAAASLAFRNTCRHPNLSISNTFGFDFGFLMSAVDVGVDFGF